MRVFDLIDFVLNIPFEILGYFTSREQRIKRKIKKTPSRSISALKKGQYVKIEGTAKIADKYMFSPLKKEKCIGYQVRVDRERADYRDDNYIDSESFQNFFVSDGQNQILVLTRGAHIMLKKESIGSSGLLKNPDENMKKFLKRHAISTTSFGLKKSLSFYEGAIQEEDTVQVVGQVAEITTKSGITVNVIKTFPKKNLYILN